MTIPFQKSIIYGPVKSRRLVKSLGINLLPTNRKICSFNCNYCQYGLTQQVNGSETSMDLFPGLAEVINALTLGLEEHPDVDFVTFSGNGEPTLHPNFAKIVDGVNNVVKTNILSNAKVALLTNGSTLVNKKTMEAISKIDRVYIKLDAPNEPLFRKINKPALSIDFNRMIESMKEVSNLRLQTMLMEGVVTNCDPKSLEDYYNLIAYLQPEEVHIYTIDRPTPVEGLLKVSPEKLNMIAETGAQKTGVPFYWF